MMNESICGFGSWAATNVGLLVIRVHARGQIPRGFLTTLLAVGREVPQDGANGEIRTHRRVLRWLTGRI